MIQPNELRIGNWYDDSGIHKQATPSTILEVFESERVWCKPIPLTPEVLEKCGFEKDGNSWKKAKLPLYLRRMNKDEYYLSVSVRFKHLHQLQNLYFALTGDELNYTP